MTQRFAVRAKDPGVSRRVVPYVVLVMTLWTLAVGCALWWNMRVVRKSAVNLMRSEAKEVTERYLLLLDPTRMTGSVHEVEKREQGRWGRVTSLDPINKTNTPDSWEAECLHAFESGAQEGSSVEPIGGQPYLRYIRPLRAQEQCLACHADRGYSKGSLMGGISVSVPLNSYLAAENADRRATALGYGAVWAMGLLGIALGGRSLHKRIAHNERSQSALRESEAKLRTMADTALNAILMMDAGGCISFYNRAAERMFGWTAEEAIGKDLHGLLAPARYRADWEKGAGLFRQSGEGPVAGKTVELTALRKDGSEFSVEIALAGVKLGVAWHAVGVVRDITEHKRMEEELRFRNVLLSTQQEAAIDGILVVDENNKIILFNRRFVDMLGVPADLVAAGADGPVLESVVEKMLQPERFLEKVRYLYEHRDEISRDEIALKDGRTFDRYSAPMCGEAGKYYGRVWYLRDVTEHKQMLRDLQQSEERYRTLFSGSQDAIMTLEPPLWRYTSGNPAAVAMFRVRDEKEFASHRPWDLSPERQPGGRSSHEYAEELMETAMREGGNFFEWRHKGLGGEEFPATILLTRLEIGGHALLQATVRDVSRQKQIEMELNQALKLDAVGRLAAGLAHEINTPAQYVGDNIEFLQIAYNSLVELARAVPSVLAAGREGPIPPPLLSQVNGLIEHANLDYLAEQIPRAIEQSIEGMGRITTIIQAMKEFSQPGIAERTTVDLNQCIRGTATVSRSEWKNVADLELDLDNNLPPVLCLPGDFNQAILNLIVNAAHAIGDVVATKVAGDGAGHKGKITIRTRQDGAWADVRIADTGTGIPEEIRDRIFDPFFTTKEVGKGTGQGLAIARNIIVDKHGGTISVESKVGKGSTFIIRLPIENADSADGPPPGVLIAPTTKAGIQ